MKEYLVNQSGQMFVYSILILTVLIILVVAIIGGSLTFFQSSKYSVESIQATNLAEAGIDKAVASLNATGGTYNGEAETSLGYGSYGVSVTSKSPTTILVQSTGYIPNKTNPKTKRTISIQVSKGTGISFVYGLLVGNGGLSMGNNSSINGSIYSNGNITGGNNNTITGDAYVAGGTQPTANQEASCSSPNCLDFIFGKSVSGQNQLDIAQSFKPSTNSVLNKISLKLKKVGSPSNITVRILGDNNGRPNKSNVLVSGTLLANLVTTSYGFVDVTFASSPTLVANTTYWIMLDTSSNNTNYWSWSEDSLQGYTRGQAFWSPDWNGSTWNSINGDMDFKVWMGGVPTYISMGNGSRVNGNLHANTITNMIIGKDAYYQTIASSSVTGTSYPNSADPAPISMPISDANILDWQDDASSYGTTNGNIIGCPQKIGPGKINGNITTGTSCTITVVTPLWITGNLVINNSVIFKMDPSLGSSSGVIIVNGTTSFANSDNLLGTGVAGSYLTLLSTYDSLLHANTPAITTGNSSITGILYAPKGIINLANNATFKEAVGWKINMGNGTTLTYDSGLVSTFFSTGPGGSFSAIKGTYQLK